MNYIVVDDQTKESFLQNEECGDEILFRKKLK